MEAGNREPTQNSPQEFLTIQYSVPSSSMPQPATDTMWFGKERGWNSEKTPPEYSSRPSVAIRAQLRDKGELLKCVSCSFESLQAKVLHTVFYFESPEGCLCNSYFYLFKVPLTHKSALKSSFLTGWFLNAYIWKDACLKVESRCFFYVMVCEFLWVFSSPFTFSCYLLKFFWILFSLQFLFESVSTLWVSLLSPPDVLSCLLSLHHRVVPCSCSSPGSTHLITHHTI